MRRLLSVGYKIVAFKFELAILWGTKNPPDDDGGG
jgi:hypothetical protein